MSQLLFKRKPDWLKVRFPSGEGYNRIRNLVNKFNLNTICQEAKCPNTAECWNKGTATILILGDTCTRNCSYCSVKTGIPKKHDLDEPKKVANLVKKLGLNFAVITSVTRDDLNDYGASIFAETIREIKKLNCKVEVLTPDFNGSESSIKNVLEALPDVFAHNMEVTEKLFPKIRPQGNYNLSLKFLKKIKELNTKMLTKSGIMVGLGETKNDIIKTMHDLRKVNCNIFTIGQYLQPTKSNHPVMKFYTPKEFSELKKYGESIGFDFVHSAPLVRRSYHAEQCFLKDN